MNAETPWQLRAFDKTLKKKIKIGLIKTRLGNLDGARCLLITCGENNGAFNYRLRELGGHWTWAEFEAIAIDEMQQLLAEPIVRLTKDRPSLPLESDKFDWVVALDAHEHLVDPDIFTAEISRVTKTGGRAIISVPSANRRMLVSKMKRFFGMPESLYGHLVPGYEIGEIQDMLSRAGLTPTHGRYYSKFFTELLELLLNLAYVKVFSKKAGSGAGEESVAPTTHAQMSRISGGMKVYALIYPIFRLFSAMDALLPTSRGYAALVEAAKEP